MIETTDYKTFLANKLVTVPACGFEVRESDLNPALFEWQKAITQWNCRRGWSSLFAACGMGKSPMQLDWCRLVFEQTRRPVMLLAPLGVTLQLRQEGEKFGVPVNVLRTGREKLAEVNVCNYERLHHWAPDQFSGLDLDEASILKGFSGKFRREVTDWARQVAYRLTASATPAPNDTVELTTQSEFLGVMSAKEVCGEFFRTEGEVSNRWILKKHAKDSFYAWLASWAIALRKPSDLGYSDLGFNLPPLEMHEHVVESPLPQDALLRSEARGIQEQRRVRRETLKERVGLAVELANTTDKPFLVWCDLNEESDLLKKMIPHAVEVRGSQSLEEKESGLLGFADGTHRVLVSKPSICGHGMNWQHCGDMAFVGLSNSYEQIHQAIRRCLRFGRTGTVNAHLVITDADGPVIRNIQRKERQADEMMDELVKRMGDLSAVSARRQVIEYRPEQPMIRPDWLKSAA